MKKEDEKAPVLKKKPKTKESKNSAQLEEDELMKKLRNQVKAKLGLQADSAEESDEEAPVLKPKTKEEESDEEAPVVKKKPKTEEEPDEESPVLKPKTKESIEDKKNFKGTYLFEWQFPKGDKHDLRKVARSEDYLYINCVEQKEIYRYSLDGKHINSLKYYAEAMEIVNNQLYLMDQTKFFIVDIKMNSIIQNWNLPKENNKSVGGLYLKVDQKVDQEKIYFAPYVNDIHFVYLFNKNGKEIKKFGKKKESLNDGEFNGPSGLTVNENYLYVCDYMNHRVQIVDKENGNFIHQWIEGQRSFVNPESILLYEHLFYVGDKDGIQVFTKDNKCIQLIGSSGSDTGQFSSVTGICIANEKLFFVDHLNNRIQVWK